ncbi:bifunctional DNA primase/polymerase [Mesorhizobium sp. M0320]|uniref:bifunctional DNA primase/polymerase n=1 Tax=Mesorhizobium sp. M0320 TaxID=2956936 RepID=UPI00333A1B57
MNNTKLTAALDAASRGFRVFPVWRDSKIPWAKGWQAAATTDESQIREWWGENPNWNIGVATGCGLVVVDVDVKNGKPGAASLEMLEMMGLPTSLRVRTPTGGTHVYVAVGDRHSGREGNIEGFPGLDTRGDGNLVLWPGSNIGRNKYEIETDTPPAPCPSWLFDIIETKTTLRVDRADEWLVEPDLPANIARAIAWLEGPAPEALEGANGDRTTFSVCAELRAMGVSEGRAFDLMADHWNETKADPSWLPDELQVKIANAYAYGQGSFGGKTAAGEFTEEVNVPPPSADIQANIAEWAERFRNRQLPQDQPDRRRRILTYAEMLRMPAPEWLVEGVIQKRSAALMFGRSNSFKSFLAVDLALSVDTGRDWHGRSVQKGRSLLVATEGANGVGRLRVPGWYDHYQVDPDSRGALLLPNEISLDVKSDVEWLLKEIAAHGPIDLLVLDIFGGTMSGTEVEDTTARAWVRAIQHIMTQTGAATLTVAHTGWQDDSRARMHTHFWGSFDSRLRVEGDKDARTSCLAVERHKDADSTGSWGFSLAPSCGTLVPILDATVGPDKTAKWSRANRVAMQALDVAIERDGVLKSGDGWPQCKVISVEAWRNECDALELSAGNPPARRMAFNRAREWLREKGTIQGFEGHVWGTFEALAVT